MDVLDYLLLYNYSKTTDLVVRVIQLQARKWDKSGGNVFVPSASSSSSQAATTAAATEAGPVTSTLNTDAPPFIPSGEMEFHYQQPVRNAGESHKLLKLCLEYSVQLLIYLEEWKDYFEGDDNDFTDQPE